MFEKLLALYLAGVLCAFGLSMPYVKYKYPEESGWIQFSTSLGMSTLSWLIVGAAIGDILVDIEKNKAEIAK